MPEEGTVAEPALPITELVSDRLFKDVREGLRRSGGGLGCSLAETLLQLAFRPLPAIPYLKITDHGLVAA